jgi:peroxiredoxin
MSQMREFARHKQDFENDRAEIVGISVDDPEHVRQVWEKAANHNFTHLSDPAAKVIRQYGLLHEHGKGDEDIAIRATLLLDQDGNERWRHVSSTVGEVATSQEVLEQIRKME